MKYKVFELYYLNYHNIIIKMVKAKRCHMLIKNKQTKQRVCKNKTHFYFCKKHQIESFNEDFSICYFCGDECNPSSQSCGRCARSVSMYGFC
jgi:hypothetical protein